MANNNPLAQSQVQSSPIQALAAQNGPAASTPTGAMPPAARPRITDTELYTVNEKTDTVRGQLDNYSDFSSPLMKRYAQQGRADAVSRGLTNSTVAAQGGMGVVLDQAGKFAVADAGIYNDRKTETVRSKTALESADIGADASRYGTDKQYDASIKTAEISAKSAIDTTNLQSASALERAQLQVKADRDLQWGALSSSNYQADQNRKSDERIAKMNSDTQLRLDQTRMSFDQSKLSAEIKNNIYSDISAGINNIDSNASRESQNEQAKRIMEFGSIRLKASGLIDEALAAL